MKRVNFHEPKANLSSLLTTVESSAESFVICRNGTPVDKFASHGSVGRIKPDPYLSRITISYDPVESLTHDEGQNLKE